MGASQRDHVIADCWFASAIWGFFAHALGLSRFSSKGILMRLQYWWSSASFNSAKGSVLILLPSLICWEVWKVRCRMFHNGGNACPSQVCRQIQLNALSISHVFPFEQATLEDLRLMSLGLVSRLSRSKPKVPVSILWKWPSPGTVKLNVDGSFLGNPGPSGGGGVVRSPSDDVLFGFAMSFGIKTNMEAEALALLDGIKLCIERGHTAVDIETDLKTLAHML